MNRKFAIECAAVLALAAASSASLAAVTLPKEGDIDLTSCWSGTANEIAFTKDTTATSYEMLGTIMSNIPNGLGDRNTFRCVGTFNNVKGKVSGGNFCESIDLDGDKRLTRFELQDDKVVREFVAGTGKYEGMTMNATVVPFPSFKDHKPGTFQGCNRQKGTYKLK